VYRPTASRQIKVRASHLEQVVGLAVRRGQLYALELSDARRAGPGAALAGGQRREPGHGAVGADVVHESIHAFRAWAVIIHATTIGGSATITGGGRTLDCTKVAPYGGPFYSVVEDSTVHGDLVIRGLHSCWLGVIRNQVGGSVRLIGNRFGDPDAMEIVTNTIAGNLACFNNKPHAQVGDSMGEPNIVGGQKRGECATAGR
jgi:hypothetical protein